MKIILIGILSSSYIFKTLQANLLLQQEILDQVSLNWYANFLNLDPETIQNLNFLDQNIFSIEGLADHHGADYFLDMVGQLEMAARIELYQNYEIRNCDFNTVEYKIPETEFLNFDGVATGCEQANQEASMCEIKACQIESTFVLNLFENYKSQKLAEPLEYKIPEWDTRASSSKVPRYLTVINPANPGNPTSYHFCGNAYRYAYKHFQGTYKCCVNKVYKATEEFCCEDGVIRKSRGLCPASIANAGKIQNASNGKWYSRQEVNKWAGKKGKWASGKKNGR